MREARERVRSRLTSCQHARNTPVLARPDYIEYEQGAQCAVWCKVCGGPIKTMAPVKRFEEAQTVRGKTVVRERLMLIECASYAEVCIEFDDGSAHVTPLCSSCADTLDPSMMEDVYCADMQWFLQLENEGLAEVLWQHWADRTPIAWHRTR